MLPLNFCWGRYWYAGLIIPKLGVATQGRRMKGKLELGGLDDRSSSGFGRIPILCISFMYVYVLNMFTVKRGELSEYMYKMMSKPIAHDTTY